MVHYTNNLQRLEDAMEAADIAWWEVEFPSGTVFFSENKTKMLGYVNKDFFHYSHFTDLLHPDDHPIAMAAMEKLLTGQSDTYESTYRIKASDGTYKMLHDKGKIVSRSGKEFCVAGVVRMIVEESM